VHVDEQIQILRRGTTEIISEADLKKKLEKGTPLRVKLGVDPTARDVTLGWAVVLRKLRDFQKLGHTACLIIGDFTAMIGDPSGKSKTRKQLTREEVQHNIDGIKDQLFKILDPEKTEIYYNKDWLGAMAFEDVIRLCSRTTVARIMERNDFRKRWREQRPIALHELLYPLCQGMDSVEIKADIELGGNDQKFNNLVGRDLQQHYGQEPQVVLLCPLLVGTDGKQKMSQSLGNYVSVIDSPNEIFGKTMSIPDYLIANWFELCTDVDMTWVHVEMLKCFGFVAYRKILRMSGKTKAEVTHIVFSVNHLVPSRLLRNVQRPNPRDLKVRLAKEIVALYHSPEAAVEAERFFIETFSKRNAPVDAPEAQIPAELGDSFTLPHLIVALGLAESNGKARKLMEAGAVALDADKQSDPTAKHDRATLQGKTLRVGKHQFRTLA
jgi:tyrosyl-tRNA synthetase